MIPKRYRSDVVLSGGASGEFVRSLKGPPDSYIRGGGDHVFETDSSGKVIRDISPLRVKIRLQNAAPSGSVFDVMQKLDGPVTLQDLAILRRMGVPR